MSERRARHRTLTIAEIKGAALDQIAAEGAPALSIRGVARAIGMSPAGLYRYYASRDDLLTDLLVDAYSDLADAVAAAAGLHPGPPDDPRPTDVPDPLAALIAAIGAYRTWAITHPARFLLIFGTPVPGYEAPEGGATVVANRRMGQVFFALAAQAWREGRIAAPPAGPAATREEEQLLIELRMLAADFPVELIPVMLGGWALWHGLVTLEVTGQLHWVYPDAGGFFAARVDAWLEAFRTAPR
jgi:AcrR family transcriptional regulator